MDFLSGSNDLGTLGLGLLMAGAAAGLFSGVLGRGAGLILVPALFLVAQSAGLRPDSAIHVAVGTSFLCLVPLALLHASRMKPGLRRLVLPVLAGLVLAIGLTLLFHPLNGIVLIYIFAAAALAAVVLTVAVDPARVRIEGRGLAAAIVAFVGTLVSGLTGLGGTALTTPALIATGVPPKDAATAAAWFAIPITIAGAVAALVSGWDADGLPRYSYGYVNLLAFGVAAPVAFATNLIAAHYADVLEAKKLRLLFAAFVVFSVARMVWSVVG
jgi:Sulfite exporter TauE/SafE.